MNRILLYMSAVIIFAASIFSLLNVRSKFVGLANRLDKMSLVADSLQNQIDSLSSNFITPKKEIVNIEKPINPSVTKSLNFDTDSIYSIGARSFYFPSNMYFDSGFLLLNEIEPVNYLYGVQQYFPSALSVNIKDIMLSPFEIKNGKVLIRTTIRDTLGNPAVIIRNDSIIIANPSKNKCKIAFSPNNMTVLSPTGRVLTCIRKIVDDDGKQYMQISGQFSSIYPGVQLLLGENQTVALPSTRVENVPGRLNDTYNSLYISDPFIYKDGILVGEKIGVLKAAQNPA